MAVPAVAGVINFTDCVPDTDAELRLSVQAMRLFGRSVTFGGVGGGPEGQREAANTLVGVLDAARLPSGIEPAGVAVILINAANRNDGSPWDNGPPFGYFQVPDTGTLVVSTLNEELLAAARSHDLVRELRMLDIPTVMKWGQDRLGLLHEEAEAITNTQFRSLWFQGLAARLVLEFGDRLPFESYQLTGTSETTGRVVRIDRFGHLITDVLVTQVPGFVPDTDIRIPLVTGEWVPCHWRLADGIPGELAAIRSSSGYREGLHVMISVPGLNHRAAANRLKIPVPGRELIDLSQLALT